MITTERTVVPAPPGRGGWRDLVNGPGEPRSGFPVHSGGSALVALVHLSDLHLCDAESPARQEYLDRHGDPGAPYAGRLGVIGTYRPQEILTVQVAAGALGAVHRLTTGPATGRPMDAVLVTGDVTDNAQRNELRWYTDLMSGALMTPFSGDERHSGWVGAVGAAVWSEHYWHPDGPADGHAEDLPTARWGYPRLPRLVEAARIPFRSPGAGLPWLTVHGNHDALLQGTVPATADLCALAVGDERVVGLAAGQTPLVVLDATAPIGPARYTHDGSSARSPVVADPSREISTTDWFVAATGAGTGAGTGTFTSPSPSPSPSGPFARSEAYWARDVGQVRLIALDTVNPHGGWQGSIATRQLEWLAEELTRSRDRYVVVTSHHPSWTLVNGYVAPGSSPRHLADEVLALLLRHRGVIAWVAGHVHAHTHLWHQAPDRAGGLWEITTSSLIDWPQQFRALEIVREPAGGLAIASTVLDHVGGPDWRRRDLAAPDVLAAVSRTLAANDYRGRDGKLAAAAGRPADRNAVWRLPDPFASVGSVELRRAPWRSAAARAEPA